MFENFPQEATKQIERSETEPSLSSLVQRWLERTPGLELDGFNFWGKYQRAVEILLGEQIILANVSNIIVFLSAALLLNDNVAGKGGIHSAVPTQ